MSKAWDALDQTDREQLIGYVLGEHRDELGILYAIASDHEDREVRAAAKVAEAALQRCCAMLARRYEGDLAHTMETRRGEAAVSMLATTLALVGIPESRRLVFADSGWAAEAQKEVDAAIAQLGQSMRNNMLRCGWCNAAPDKPHGDWCPTRPAHNHAVKPEPEGPVGIDGTSPRVPVPEGWTYLGRAGGEFGLLYDVATDGYRMSLLTKRDGEHLIRHDSAMVTVDMMRRSCLKETVAAVGLYDAWKAKP